LGISNVEGGTTVSVGPNLQGSFVINSLTSTNAVIVLKADGNAVEMNVSRQRLSKCRPKMAVATPWVGHSGRINKRRQVRRNKPQGSVQEEESVVRTCYCC